MPKNRQDPEEKALRDTGRLYAQRNIKHTEPYMQNRKIQEMIRHAEDVMDQNHFEG